MSLGDRIRDIRTRRSFQQRELAAKAGLTSSLVSQVERGRLTPSIATLRKLAQALGGPGSQFFEETPHGKITVVRRRQQAVLKFDGSSEQWAVLASGLVQGKIRAVVASRGPREEAASGDKIVVDPGQMKPCYVIEGQVMLR